jgi:RNA polymerase sigma factor (sigma-70 family)
MSDEELMLAYYGCNDYAFAELHGRYLAPLGARALGILNAAGKPPAGRREKAEELAADALINAAATKARPSARWDPTKGSVKAWLHRILFNRVMTYLRKKHHFEICETDLPQQDGTDEQSRPLESLAAARGPDMPDDELLDALRDCIERLPWRERVVFTLVFFEGWEQTDVAELLGVSNATVTRLKQQVLKRLFDCLKNKGAI